MEASARIRCLSWGRQEPKVAECQSQENPDQCEFQAWVGPGGMCTQSWHMGRAKREGKESKVKSSLVALDRTESSKTVSQLRSALRSTGQAGLP